MPLGEYRRKRLPGGTPEPLPEHDPERAGAGTTARGVFVVHAHGARRLHFDLRLEAAGALLSFALPKGVSLDPEVRLLAIRTEDHPLAYVDFEDTIPAGQYGAGPMIAWDRGLVRWLEIPAEEQLTRGKLDFVLYGRKLRGRFSLVPLKDPPSYLLLKKKDAHARAGGIDLDERSVFSGLPLAALPGHRKLGAELVAHTGTLHGVRVSTTEPALCPRTTTPWSPAERAEAQCDFVPSGAFRALLQRRGNQAHIQSEQGTELTTLYPDVAAALRHTLVDELAVEALLWRDPEPDLGPAPLPCQALVVDVLRVGPHDCTHVPVDVRRALATRLFPGAGILRTLAPFPGLPSTLLHHARELAPAFLGVLGRTTHAVLYEALDPGAPFAPPPLPAALAIAPRKLTLTNRQKPFFPAAGLTKGDLLDYYDAVADTLLPHLRDRLVILERFPDGVDGKHFFQWRPPPSAPSWLGSVEIPEHREGQVREPGKEPKRAFLLHDRESLLYVVNLGCIPLHLLGFDPRAPSLCTFATFDFDVKQASLDLARPLVRALRRLLDHAELASYLKTSGKTGLHVLVPLGAEIPFAAAHSLVDLLGGWLTALHPDTATREAFIEKRGHRVYVDTGQTGAIKAIAAPYSVRPVHDARVSMPVPWEQLETLDPAAFTIRTVPALLASHTDPWASFRGQNPDLRRALSRLQALAAGGGPAIS